MGLGKAIYVYNYLNGKLVKSIVGHAGSVMAVYLDEKRDLVLSCSYDTSIRAWCLSNSRCLAVLNGYVLWGCPMLVWCDDVA